MHIAPKRRYRGMTSYHAALAEIRKYGGPWEVFKMRCFSVWIEIEARCLPTASRARAVRAMQSPQPPRVQPVPTLKLPK